MPVMSGCVWDVSPPNLYLKATLHSLFMLRHLVHHVKFATSPFPIS